MEGVVEHIEEELIAMQLMHTRKYNAILDCIKYKPGWLFLVIGSDLQVEFRADSGIWRGRKWRLSEHMTDSEIVQTAFAAVLAAEEHEARELFLLHGQAVLGPHLDLFNQARLLNEGVVMLDERA